MRNGTIVIALQNTKQNMKQEQDEKEKIVTLDYQKNAITIILQMGECMNEWTNFNVIV